MPNHERRFDRNAFRDRVVSLLEHVFHQDRDTYQAMADRAQVSLEGIAAELITTELADQYRVVPVDVGPFYGRLKAHLGGGKYLWTRLRSTVEGGFEDDPEASKDLHAWSANKREDLPIGSIVRPLFMPYSNEYRFEG